MCLQKIIKGFEKISRACATSVAFFKIGTGTSLRLFESGTISWYVEPFIGVTNGRYCRYARRAVAAMCTTQSNSDLMLARSPTECPRNLGAVVKFRLKKVAMGDTIPTVAWLKHGQAGEVALDVMPIGCSPIQKSCRPRHRALAYATCELSDAFT